MGIDGWRADPKRGGGREKLHHAGGNTHGALSLYSHAAQRQRGNKTLLGRRERERERERSFESGVRGTFCHAGREILFGAGAGRLHGKYEIIYRASTGDGEGGGGTWRKKGGRGECTAQWKVERGNMCLCVLEKSLFYSSP